MPDVVCPECGLITTLDAIRRRFDEFCSHCDFPLFWAPSAVPVASESRSNDATLRRLPGAGGLQMIGTRVCPSCGEQNPIGDRICWRCKFDMEPQPVLEEPEPEPPPPPPPAPPPAPPPKRNWVPWIVLGVVTVLIIIVILMIA